MKSYGQDESADGTMLAVYSDQSHIVGFAVYPRAMYAVAFLAVSEVVDLVGQLRAWLDEQPRGNKE